MADRLRIPFGYFYLSSPPAEEPFPLPDFRNETASPPSIDLVEVIHDAQRKQSWYREEMQYQERSPLPFVGRFNPNSPPQDITDDICGTIGIDGDMRQETGSWTAFLAELVRRTEDYGILVLRSGVAAGNTHRKLDVVEFHGFALPDPLAPIVFVNAQDGIVAQIFTLAHELAHIWIGEPSLCSPNFRLARPDCENPVEQVCNGVAEKLLEPEVAFLHDILECSWTSENSYWKRYVPNAAKHINTGRYMNYLAPVLARNSKRFTAAVIAAMLEERIGYIDTTRLLNTTVNTMEDLTTHLFGVSLNNA